MWSFWTYGIFHKMKGDLKNLYLKLLITQYNVLQKNTYTSVDKSDQNDWMINNFMSHLPIAIGMIAFWQPHWMKERIFVFETWQNKIHCSNLEHCKMEVIGFRSFVCRHSIDWNSSNATMAIHQVYTWEYTGLIS